MFCNKALIVYICIAKVFELVSFCNGLVAQLDRATAF